MNISEYITLCKQNSYEFKKFYPTPESHNTFLDMSAQEFGFKHYTAMIKLQKLLPPEVTVNHEAIEKAGGNYCEYLTKGIFYKVDSAKNMIKHRIELSDMFLKPVEDFLENNKHEDACECLTILSHAGDMTLNSKWFSDDTRLLAIKAVEKVITDSRLLRNWKEASLDWNEGYKHWIRPREQLIDKLKSQLSSIH